MTDDIEKNENPKSLIEFPCDFPIKILGKSGFDFESAVLMIIRKHIPNLPEGAIQLKPSEKGSYLSITAVVYVESQAQLDAIYQDLVASELVMMVL